MADEAQVIYEYTSGNTISFKTNDLQIGFTRPKMRVDTAVDGTILVTDPGNSQLTWTFTALISGNDMDTLHGVQTGAITYSGGFPRIQKIYWDGDSTETNTECALTSLTATDLGGYWRVSITLVEKDQ
jgi:hypothetical protein